MSNMIVLVAFVFSIRCFLPITHIYVYYPINATLNWDSLIYDSYEIDQWWSFILLIFIIRLYLVFLKCALFLLHCYIQRKRRRRSRIYHVISIFHVARWWYTLSHCIHNYLHAISQRPYALRVSEGLIIDALDLLWITPNSKPVSDWIDSEAHNKARIRAGTSYRRCCGLLFFNIICECRQFSFADACVHAEVHLCS